MQPKSRAVFDEIAQHPGSCATSLLRPRPDRGQKCANDRSGLHLKTRMPKTVLQHPTPIAEWLPMAGLAVSLYMPGGLSAIVPGLRQQRGPPSKNCPSVRNSMLSSFFACNLRLSEVHSLSQKCPRAPTWRPKACLSAAPQSHRCWPPPNRPAHVIAVHGS